MTEEQKNKDFVQLYRNSIDSVGQLALDNPRAYSLFMFFLKHMDHSNALIVSNMVLQEVFNCGKATICRAIKYLKNNGWICVLKSGTSNVYIVNPEVAWTSYGSQKEFCKFEGTILLSKTENAAYLNNPEAKAFYKRIDDDFVNHVKDVRAGSLR